MHKGFVFEVHDLIKKRRIMFKCPEEIYSLLAYIGAPSRYVIKHVFKKDGDYCCIHKHAAPEPDCQAGMSERMTRS